MQCCIGVYIQLKHRNDILSIYEIQKKKKRTWKLCCAQYVLILKYLQKEFLSCQKIHNILSCNNIILILSAVTELIIFAYKGRLSPHLCSHGLQF